MNTDRIRTLAKKIKTQPHVLSPLKDKDEDEISSQHPTSVPDGFNMGVYHCDTAGCIAGWAVALFGHGYPPSTGELTEIHEWAQELLDLSDDESDSLFIAYPRELETITPEEAARTLEKVADAYDKAEIRDGDKPINFDTVIEAMWRESAEG